MKCQDSIFMEENAMGLGTANLVKILQVIKENGTQGKSLCMIGKQDIHIRWDNMREIIHKYHSI